MMANTTNPAPEEGALFREFEHTGDIGIEVAAPTRKELFRRAALALGAVMVERSTVAPREERRFELQAADNLDLMHDMLTSLLNRFVIDGFIWCDASIAESHSGLTIALRGEPFSAQRHGFRGEVKAITYHQLSVEQSISGWRARIILDV